MSEAVTTNEDGAIVIDMAKADALWRSLDPLKQAELTNMMFEPVLKKAKEQADRIEQLVATREELEAKLSESEALLAKAVEALEDIFGNGSAAGRNPQLIANKARTTLAELKGQNDD